MHQRTMGWVTVFLLFVVYGINYLDRVALSIVAPMVRRDLGIDAAQMGVVFSTFFVGYALFNFIGGLASDRLGPKRVYVIAVGLWSIFCGMTAITIGFVSLLIVRLLFGMAEGPLCSAANKMVNNWLPRESAATAMGLLSAGSPLGGALAGPIVGVLAAQLGWRPAFWIVCAIGLAWVLVWIATTSDRPAPQASAMPAGGSGAAAAAAPRACASGGRTADAAHASETADVPPLRDYLKQPRILATGVAFFGYNYVLFFFLSWFPSYLVQAHHLNIREMSVATVVPWLVGTIGLACGGVISDGIYKLTGNAMLSRRIVLVGCLLGAGVCVAIAGSVRSTQSAIALMSVSLFSFTRRARSTGRSFRTSSRRGASARSAAACTAWEACRASSGPPSPDSSSSAAARSCPRSCLPARSRSRARCCPRSSCATVRAMRVCCAKVRFCRRGCEACGLGANAGGGWMPSRPPAHAPSPTSAVRRRRPGDRWRESVAGDGLR